MIDHVDAATNRLLYRLCRTRMAIDFLAEVSRHTHRHLYLIVTHHGKAAVSRGTQVVSGNIHFDVVYAFAATQPHNLPYLLRPIGDHTEAFVILMRFAFVPGRQ